MILETARQHLSELRERPMYRGEPMFGYFRYEEMLNDEAALLVFIESFSQPDLRSSRALYEQRKHELLDQVKQSHQDRVRPTCKGLAAAEHSQ